METVTMFDCYLNVLHHHKVRADYASAILDAADSKLLSAHYDPETAHSLNEVRQVVWLENDKNDEVYAYLYVEGLLDSFDQIGFDSIRKYPSRIIHWNAQTSHFDRAYANQSGRREISVLPNRQVFWTFHKFTDLTNWVEQKAEYSEDVIVAVFDTFPSKVSIVEAEDVLQKVDLYPNPNQGLVHIHNGEDETVAISIYEATGRLVKQVFVEANSDTKVNYGASPGVYIIHLLSESGKRASRKMARE